LTLGRGGSSDVELDASGVSREHAVLTRQGPVYAIADAKSTNGTFVNGVRIEHAALAQNDVVRLGDLVGVVIRAPVDDTGTSDVRLVGDALFGPGLAAAREILDKCARSPLPVVLIGETGVGKEAVARALHVLSGRDGPFHAVNCAALPASLAEAELFGYRKGAFTGAEQAAIGHLRAAEGGTLLLDELADLALPAQAKLLRALQDSQVTALGETKATSVDLRVVAACQTPLSELVATGRLREDLMMRLNGFTLTLPPLRERRVDVGLLFRHFVDRFASTEVEIEPRALEQVLLGAWPGNVRELELFTRRLLTLQPGASRLRRSMLPDSMKSPSDSNPPPRDDAASPLDRKKHDLLALCLELEKNGGSVAAAAITIGISRQRAYRLMEKKRVDELLTIVKKKPGA
jgi:transcriptional regulator with PAS, ATPase and Fis domain